MDLIEEFEKAGYPVSWIDNTNYEEIERENNIKRKSLEKKVDTLTVKVKDASEIVHQSNNGVGFIFWIILGLAFCVAAGYSLSKCTM